MATTQYLVEVKYKNNRDFIKEFGKVVYVAKLMPIVILETDKKSALRLQNHNEVINIRESRTFHL